MISETRKCQNCSREFQIEPEDFDFYKKIDVPPPTWCWLCRLKRKAARRNERILHKGQCKLCEKEIISLYGEASSFSIYCNDCWWSDKWDPLSYERVYDFSKSFFQQFYELSLAVPRVALYQKGNVNSPYTNHADHNKNCYLCFNNGFIEDSLYCGWGIKSREIVDCYNVQYSETVYGSQNSERCSNCLFVHYSYDCLDSAFLFNCKGCHHCFLCSNLRNKSYCFANEQLTKEEYEKRITELDLGSYKILEATLKRFYEEVLPSALRKYAMAEKVIDSTGDNLYECKHVKYGFHVSEAEDCAYCIDAIGLKDSYDTYESGFRCELQYDCHACNRVSHSKFSTISYDNHHLEYAEMCHGSSHLFGCISLRNKQYCILNKQYSKKEYEELVSKIKQYMNEQPYTDSRGRVYTYGEFFPPELSPFAYNETTAQEYFPLDRGEVEKQGFSWEEPDTKDYQVTIKPSDLSDHIKDVDDSILKETIGCEHQGKCNEQCTTAFKIIPQELQFYKKMNLPLPRLCPNCRHYRRLKQRNPLKLWHRKCQCAGMKSENAAYQNSVEHFHSKDPCSNEFETSYTPDRKEVVYCEQCYNAEIV